MSLQIGINPNINIYQFAGYAQKPQADGMSGTAGISASEVKQTEDNQADKLMKQQGVKECMTCQSRKYIDGSNDAGVSFKVPTHVSAGSSGAAVMSHEQEHVTREGAKAQLEGRKIVSQTVQIYTATCPECGKVYTSGGKTTTTTKADTKSTDYFMDNVKKAIGSHYGKYVDVKV